MKTVVGMFSDVSGAQRTFEDLMKFGVGPNDISIVTKQSKPGDAIKLSSLNVSDAGSIAARGPIATALTRDQRGLMGTLQSAGVSQALAEHYAKAVSHGETLEFVVVEDRQADRVVEIMKRHAANYSAADEKVASSRAATAAVAAPAPIPRAAAPREPAREPKERREDGDRYIPILREEIQVGKREVDRGGVHVGVRVSERPVSEHVRLREEHVDVERRPVDRAPLPGEIEFRTGDLDMLERGEEVVVSKQVRVVEEVRLHKSVTERDETITDKVRSTEVEIDKLGLERDAYTSHYASLGGTNFEEARPAYEFGRGLRRSSSEQWEGIEQSARTNWEAQHPGTWAKFRDAIRYAWSRARVS